jgi:DNA-directed RNA polymerase specialized sigma24 family protein
MRSFRIVALVGPVSFEGALSAAQGHVPGAAEAFVMAHAGWITRTVSALCRRFGIPTQEHEDAVQETYRRLLDPRLERFAPGHGDAKKYARGVILNAIDFAGRRRRRAQSATSIDADQSLAEAVDLGWREPFNRADARIDLPRLAHRADDVVARAVALVCNRGLSQREASKEIGVSEFKLCRALAKFSAQVRLAA